MAQNQAATECARWLVSFGWSKNEAAAEAARRHGARYDTIRRRVQGWAFDPPPVDWNNLPEFGCLDYLPAELDWDYLPEDLAPQGLIPF
jgi:hypothetical protein